MKTDPSVDKALANDAAECARNAFHPAGRSARGRGLVWQMEDLRIDLSRQFVTPGDGEPAGAGTCRIARRRDCRPVCRCAGEFQRGRAVVYGTAGGGTDHQRRV